MLGMSLIAITLSFSLLVACSQNNMLHPTIRGVDNTQQFVLSVPLVGGVGFREDSRLLNQSTRIEIYNFVKNNPGIHFRGICNNLGLSIGVVQYHLAVLTSTYLLLVYFDGRRKRYFEPKRFGETEMKIISFLRHETIGRILAVLSQSDPILHKNLAHKLSISSQALTWQIKRLKKTGFIETVKEKMKVSYSLNSENALRVKRCLGIIGLR